jgi:dTMP kinase
MKPLDFYSYPLPGIDPTELLGKLIVIEGPDAVGRTTQLNLLSQWLQQRGHAVLQSSMAGSMLAGKGISDAKTGNTLGPLTMSLFYATDFADRLENEIIPALRAGFVVLTDRYIFSIMARGLARGEDRQWLEKLGGFALVPHAIYYLRAGTEHLVKRVVLGRGSFDYWESGMDLHFGSDMYESFVRYQSRILKALDSMAQRYRFTTIDASRSPAAIQQELQQQIELLWTPTRPPRPKTPKKAAPPKRPARKTAPRKTVL